MLDASNFFGHDKAGVMMNESDDVTTKHTCRCFISPPEPPMLCHSRSNETDMFVPIGLVNPARIPHNLFDMAVPRMVEDATFAEVGGSTTERGGEQEDISAINKFLMGSG